MAQAEQLKQQTLATLSEKDQQLRRLTAVLEEAHSHKPLLQQQHYQKQVGGINVCTLVGPNVLDGTSERRDSA